MSPDSFRMDGKRAVVTGGTRGIGFAIAEAFAAAGAEVVVSSRSADACAAAATKLGGVGIAADVADEAALDSLFARVDERGGCDVFVHCAGFAEAAKAADVPRAKLQKMLDVHLLGGIAGAQRAAAQMRPKGGGAILLIGSVWGLGGARGTLPYGVAKAGLVHAVKVLAIEWARDGIRVNGLAPGIIETDMTAELGDAAKEKLVSRVPLRRMGRPEEMAGPALLLCTDAGSYVTGQTIVADGGERAR